MRVSFVLSSLALVAAGCATESVAMRSAPDLAVAGLATPVGTETGGWSEVEPTTTVVVRPSAVRPAAAESWEHHVTAMGGQRWLDDDDWDELDEPLVFGVEFDGTDVTSGNGFEVGVLYSNDDADIGPFEAEATTWELYAGYRYTFNPQEEGIHPFLSAGVEAMNGELDVSGGGSEDDTVVGAYGRAGLLWDVSDRLRLGLDYRHLFSDDLEFDNAGGDLEANPDYDQIVFSVGWCY